MSQRCMTGNNYQQKVVMESIRIRKVKQKIAQKMVKVNALNISRPRTDKGQPSCSHDRSHTQKSFDEQPTTLHRTTSDPEFLHSRSVVEGQEELLENDHLTNEEEEETFEKIHQPDIVEEINQLPVETLITDFNRKSIIENENNNNNNNIIKNTDHKQKPIPLPRPTTKQQSLDKPKPSPRPIVRCKSLEDLTDTSTENSRQSFRDELSKRLINKPKPKPKPIKLIKQPHIENIIPETSNNNNTLLNTSSIKKQTKTSEQTKISENLIDLGEEITYENMDPSLKSKEEINYNVKPYEIVDLQNTKNKESFNNTSISLIPTSPILKSGQLTLPLPLIPVGSSPNSPFYTDMSDDSYLEPVDAHSPRQNNTLPRCHSPHDNNTLPRCPSPKSPHAKSPIDSKSKIKTKKQRLRKGKSVTNFKSHINELDLADLERRKSAPHIIHTSKERPESQPVYEAMDDRGSVMISDEDEDGWGTDEFEEEEVSSDENDYEKIDDSYIIPKLPDLDPVSRKVYNTVTEILTTERAYVKRLYLLDEIFQKRLQLEEKENNIVPEKTINEIFSNLTPIHRFHSSFLLPELEKRVKEWMDKQMIGDIFKNLGNFLKLYTVFVKNFDHATSTITHLLKKTPKFAAVITEIQKRPECENLSLQHHMLEPIQRVPRYKLLLQDYLKRLPTDHSDRKAAEDSLEIISKIAQEANNSMKENEKFKKLLDIEDRIFDGLKGESLVTASRVFLKEGELTKLAARKESSTMARTMLLFTDILLCCAATTTKKLRVRQIMDVEGLEIDTDDTLPPHAFRIKSRQRVLDLIARDEDEKDDWISAIKAAVDELHDKRGNLIKEALEKDEQKMSVDKPGKQAPVWVKDEDVTMCMMCAVKFGLVHRKHHCRGCGRVTCDRCSNFKAFLEYANEQCRICFACSKKLGLDVGEINEVEFKQSVKARDSTVYTDITNNLHWKPPGKGWSKEWIALSQFALYIQKKRQDVKAHSTLPVPGFTVSQPASADEIESSHPFCIKLHKGDKKEHTYFISSDNKDVIELWRKHLECAVQLQSYQEK